MRSVTQSFSLEDNPKLTMSIIVVSEIISWVHLCNISVPTKGPWYIPIERKSDAFRYPYY